MSIHFAAIEHEEEVVQVATGCLPGHVFHFFIEELGGPQSQGCVHHLCSVNGTYDYSALSFKIEQQHSTEKMYSPSEVKSIINNLSSVDHWNVLEIGNRNWVWGLLIWKNSRNNAALSSGRGVVPDVWCSACWGDVPSSLSHSWLCRNPSYLCWPPTSH